MFYALHGIKFTAIVLEHTVDLLLQYSCRADIKEGWTCALRYIAQRKEKYLPDGDAALTWINIFKLFLEYGADPRLRVLGRGRRSDEREEYSVSDVLDRISEEHPKAAAEIYRLVNRRRQFLYRAGLSRRRKTPDPRKWNSR